MLRPFHALASEHAFALVVHLQHVKLSLLFRPAEDRLEHVRDVIHQIHRIIPANHQVARLQLAPGLGLLFLFAVRQDGRFNGFSHAGTHYSRTARFSIPAKHPLA